MVTKTTNREFGILLSLVLLIIAYIRQEQGTLYEIAILTLLIALLCPLLYTPFTRLWFKFGELLSRITTCIVLFILYFLIVTPVGRLRRMMKKDTLCIHQFKTSRESVFTTEDKTYTASDLDKQY